MKECFRLCFNFLIVLLVNFSSQAHLVETYLQEGLQIRQLPKSEKQLCIYHNLGAGSDTAYCIIVPVGNCPRCEAVIMPVIDGLKKLNPGSTIQLMAVYPDSAAARMYLHKYRIKADVVKFDTVGFYNQVYSFSAGYLHIPYLLKIVPGKGELIAGVRLENNSEDFLKEFWGQRIISVDNNYIANRKNSCS